MINGLTNEEVVKSRKAHGSNEIQASQKESFIHKLIATLGDPIIKIVN